MASAVNVYRHAIDEFHGEPGSRRVETVVDQGANAGMMKGRKRSLLVFQASNRQADVSSGKGQLDGYCLRKIGDALCPIHL
jgi:hypothetical protein